MLHRLQLRTCLSLLMLAASPLSGCAERETDPAFLPDEHTQRLEQAPAAGSTAAASDVRAKYQREIVDVWSMSGVRCASTPATAISPERLMAKVPAAERAAAIARAINEVPLGGDRVHRLLVLLSSIVDPKVPGSIKAVYDNAASIIDMNMSESLASDPDQERVYAFREDEIESVRVGAVQGVASLADPASRDLIVRALDEGEHEPQRHARLLQAASVALARRPDFSDVPRLEAARDKLHPGLRNAVTTALAAR